MEHAHATRDPQNVPSELRAATRRETDYSPVGVSLDVNRELGGERAADPRHFVAGGLKRDVLLLLDDALELVAREARWFLLSRAGLAGRLVDLARRSNDELPHSSQNGRRIRDDPDAPPRRRKVNTIIYTIIYTIMYITYITYYIIIT